MKGLKDTVKKEDFVHSNIDKQECWPFERMRR